MGPMNNNSSIGNLLSPTPEPPQVEEAPTGVIAGRDVTVHDKNGPLLPGLPELIHLKIIRCLSFREITQFAKVCRYFHDLVKNDKALERAWSRRFPSPQQYQLKTLFKTKDDHQLRAWLKPFANEDTIKSLIEQRKNIHFPAQLLFTNSKLMSLCEKFKLVEKTVITHDARIIAATLSPDGRYLATASHDNTAKICGRGTDGLWELKDIISHEESVDFANFSPDGRYLVTVSRDNTAKIHDLQDVGSLGVKATINIIFGLWFSSATFSNDGRHLVVTSANDTVKIYGLKEEDGSLEEKATISHDALVLRPTFSDDGRRVVTVNQNEVKIRSQGDDGSWRAEDIIHETVINEAKLSSDGRHLAICSAGLALKIYGQGDDGSWVKKITLQHQLTISSINFSANSRHLVSASLDCTAKICKLQDDGSWKEITRIHHDYGLYSANFSADSQHLLICGFVGGTAKIYGLQADGSWVKKTAIVHEDCIHGATFSPDGCLVATASLDSTAKIYGLWADGTWVEKAVIRHESSVTSANFSADSRNVVTVTHDNKARITELKGKIDDPMDV